MDSWYGKAAIFQWNCNGLRGKSGDFRKLVAQYKFPILCISEARSEPGFRLANYVVYTSLRANGPSRAMICVRKDIPSMLVASSAGVAPEFVRCKVIFGKLTMSVVSAYLQPQCAIPATELADMCRPDGSPIVICGDFNAHNKLWNGTTSDSRGRQVERVLNAFDFTLLNDGSPTFLRGHSYSSVLDLTFCSSDLAAGADWSTDADTRGSDHYPILIYHPSLGRKPLRRTERIVNWAAYRHANTTTLDMQSEVDNITSVLRNNLLRVTRAVPVPDGYGGVDAEYERLRATRRRAQRKYRRSGLLEDYKDAQNIFSKMQKQLQKVSFKRWDDFCASLSPFTSVTKVWNVVRAFRLPVSQLHPFRALALARGVNEVTVAEEFCTVLTRPSPAVDSQLYKDSLDVAHLALQEGLLSASPDMDQDFRLEELMNALSSARKRTAPGPDGVTYAALSNLGPKNTIGLLDLYNKIWRCERVPLSWKLAMVVPILKPGKSPMAVESFRPVSLTNCIAKIMEKMINERIQWWIENHNCLPQNLAGFRVGRCTMDCVMDLITFVEHEKTAGKITVAVFLDIKRAYDTASHAHVIEGLLQLGVKGRALRFVSDFLTQRRIVVKTIDGATTEHDLQQGVPQGSVLSPTLFNAVMAQLPRRLSPDIHCSVYADDICVWTSGPSFDDIQRTLQAAVIEVEQFLTERGMSISAEKSVVLPFSLKHLRDFKICIEGRPLDLVTTHRFLGIVLDRRLTWAHHVELLEQKVNAIIRVLRHLAGARWGSSSDAMLALHVALVRSILGYSLPILQGLSMTGERKLHLLVARSLRVCLGVPRATSGTLVIAEARQPPIPVLRLRETYRHFFRVFTQHTGHSLSQALPLRPGSRLHTLTPGYEELVPVHQPWHCLRPPWTLPPLQISLKIEGMEKKSAVSSLAAVQLSLCHLYTKHAGRTQIYTDGSCVQDSSACAFVVPSLGEGRLIKLSHLTSPTSTELYAILEAVKFIAFRQPAKKWIICSDSMSALELLCNIQAKNGYRQILLRIAEMVQLAMEAGHDVELQWVPSHSGLSGNEKADQLAKRAHAHGEEHLIPLFSHDVSSILRKFTTEKSSASWFDDAAKGSLLYAVDPELQFRFHVDLPRQVETLFHRLRLGVAYTNHFLFRIARARSTSCTCGEPDEDIPHVLLNCPLYNQQRQELYAKFSALGNRAHMSLRTFLGPWPDAGLQKRAVLALKKFFLTSGIAFRC